MANKKFNSCPKPWKNLFAKGYNNLKIYGNEGQYTINLIDICPANNVLFESRLKTKPGYKCIMDNLNTSILKTQGNNELNFMGHGTGTASVITAKLNSKAHEHKRFAYNCGNEIQCLKDVQATKSDNQHNTFAWYYNSNDKSFYATGYSNTQSKLTLCGVSPQSTIHYRPVAYNLEGRFFPPGDSKPFDIFPKILNLGKTSSGKPIKPEFSDTALYVMPLVANFDNNSSEGNHTKQLAREICRRNSENNVDQSQKIIFITAAGNYGQNLKDHNYLPAVFKDAANIYPGCKPFFVVGGVNTDKPSIKHPNSNYNSTFVDIATYYDQYVISQPANTARMDDGTSYSAPLIAAVTARLLKCRPQSSQDEVKEILYKMSKKYNHLSSDFYQGYVLSQIKKDIMKSWCTRIDHKFISTALEKTNTTYFAICINDKCVDNSMNDITMMSDDNLPLQSFNHNYYNIGITGTDYNISVVFD